MAGSKGQTFQQSYINYILGGVTGSAPFNGTPYTKVYIALFTTALADGSGLTGEVSTSGGSLYTRVGYDNTGSGRWSGTHGTRANAAAITFPTAGANWGTIHSFAIMDVTTAGAESNILFYGTLTDPVAINEGDTLRLEIGDLIINEN